jgi:hypothetical protein
VVYRLPSGMTTGIWELWKFSFLSCTLLLEGRIVLWTNS